MKNTLIIPAILISMLIASCDNMNTVTPVDTITIQEKDFTDFERISAEAAFTVYVNFSPDEEKVEIEANENLHEYIEVSKEDGELKIRLKNNTNIKGSYTLKAYITTDQITGYSASGASRLILNDMLDAQDVDIFLSGASTFTGELQASDLSANLSGASIVDLSGKCDAFKIDATGASIIKDFTFNCDFLDVNLSGASVAELTVNERIDVVASGASSVKYKGAGIVNSQNLSGSSTIMKVD